MKLLVLNPNTTQAMTDRVLADLRTLVPPTWTLRGATAAFGCEVIASRTAFVTGAYAALRTLAAQPPWADAVLLACFGDPGLAALREASALPVAGMAESALAEAVARGRPFHLLTAGAAWEAMLRDTVRLAGAEALLDGITVLEGTGRDFAADPDGARRRVQGVLDVLAARGAPTCILGGAGFAGLRPVLRYPGTRLDGLQTAVRALSTAH